MERKEKERISRTCITFSHSCGTFAGVRKDDDSEYTLVACSLKEFLIFL